MWAIPTDTSSALKKNQVKSLSIWSHAPETGSDPSIGSDRNSGCDTGYPTSTIIPQVDGLPTDPQEMGRHRGSIVSVRESQLTHRMVLA